MSDDENPFAKAAAEIARQSMADRERYVRAWLAETGMKPTDCVLEERQLPNGGRQLVIRERAEALDGRGDRAFDSGWKAAMKQCEERVAAAERSQRAAELTRELLENVIRDGALRIQQAVAKETKG